MHLVLSWSTYSVYTCSTAKHTWLTLKIRLFRGPTASPSHVYVIPQPARYPRGTRNAPRPVPPGGIRIRVNCPTHSWSRGVGARLGILVNWSLGQGVRSSSQSPCYAEPCLSYSDRTDDESHRSVYRLIMRRHARRVGSPPLIGSFFPESVSRPSRTNGRAHGSSVRMLEYR